MIGGLAAGVFINVLIVVGDVVLSGGMVVAGVFTLAWWRIVLMSPNILMPGWRSLSAVVQQEFHQSYDFCEK